MLHSFKVPVSINGEISLFFFFINVVIGEYKIWHDAYFGANWTVIPVEGGHPIRLKLDTDFGSNWTVLLNMFGASKENSSLSRKIHTESFEEAKIEHEQEANHAKFTGNTTSNPRGQVKQLPNCPELLLLPYDHQGNYHPIPRKEFDLAGSFTVG